MIRLRDFGSFWTSGVRKARPHSFVRDERGAIIVFSMYALVVMMIVSGMAYDLMHFETERVRMQAALDRSVLAAAAANQTLDAETVVQSYFDTSGIKNYVLTVSEEGGTGDRTVSAGARISVPTRFMRMIDRTMLLGMMSDKTNDHTGQMVLETNALSEASEKVKNVEISLVLDVSGSMASNNRLDHLKDAANEFVQTLQCNPEDPSGNTPCTVERDHVSVSVIPYSEQVTAGADLLAQYNVSDEHTYSNCVNFDEADFETVAIETTRQLERTGHFDPWSSGRVGARDEYRVCSTRASREIAPFENTAAGSRARIEALVAGGSTSIDIGMKWGSALLDPAARPVVDGLIGANAVAPGFAGRPAPYSDTETLKVIVLMTDGENTYQNELLSAYRSGLSPFYKNAENDMYIVQGPSENQFYYPKYEAWRDTPFERYDEHEHEWVKNPDEVTRMTFPALWNEVSVYYYERFTWLGSPTGYEGPATKNTRLRTACNAAKANGIVVFTIGFEAQQGADTVLQDCATSVNHYYESDGLDIADAFNSIAGAINNLKLTQ